MAIITPECFAGRHENCPTCGPGWTCECSCHPNPDDEPGEVLTIAHAEPTTVHGDWDEDGVEEDENLWRLDFDDNETQLQLFATVKDAKADKPEYTGECRLLVEIDRRDPATDNEKRVHYACKVWKIDATTAANLLSKPKQELLTELADEIAEVKARPCDKTMLCDGCDGSGIRPDATPHAGPPPEGFVVIEKCDTCDKFADDLAAAQTWGTDARWQEGNGTMNAIARPKGSAVPQQDRPTKKMTINLQVAVEVESDDLPSQHCIEQEVIDAVKEALISAHLNGFDHDLDASMTPQAIGLVGQLPLLPIHV